jgi:hypothetical protein
MPSFVSGGTRASLCALVSLLAVLAIAPAAQAANEVNYTVHVPASVQTNPCFPGDVLNLNGDVHIVISWTQSGAGYRMNNHVNSLLSGASITTGTRYVNSEDQDDSWFAGAPFPTVHTHTYDFDLLSKGGTANYVMHMTMHETVNALGVPTAAVDQFQTDCRG